MPIPVDKSKQKPKSPSSSISSSIAKDDWSSLSDDEIIAGLDTRIKGRSFGLIFGGDGAGKTTYITRYAPDPVLLLNYDYRADDAVEEARSMGRTIHYHVIDIPSEYGSSEEIKLAANEAIERNIRILSAGVRKSRTREIRTIGIDTGDELTNMFNVGFFGSFDNWESAFQKDKAYVKRQWMRVIRLCRQSHAHVIITARESEIWGKSSSGGGTTGPSGKFKPDVAKIANSAVDWAAHIRTKDRMDGKGKKFELEVTKGGPNFEEEGQVYKEKEWNKVGGPFIYTAMRIYGGELGDWK